jgi:hypothetical protein
LRKKPSHVAVGVKVNDHVNVNVNVNDMFRQAFLRRELGPERRTA